MRSGNSIHSTARWPGIARGHRGETAAERARTRAPRAPETVRSYHSLRTGPVRARVVSQIRRPPPEPRPSCEPDAGDEQLREVPHFRAGDTLRVHLRIREGERERVQVFEGVCIGRSGSGVTETFMVRKTSYGVGVERVFPVHSPRVEKVEVKRSGVVRRAKLYFLRGRVGKAVRLKERRRS